MKVIKTSIKIQKTQYDKKALVELGLSEDIMSCVRVKADDELNSKLREIISNALKGAIETISSVSPEDSEFIKASLQRNIGNFELTAGTGFTQEHKANLSKELGKNSSKVFPDAPQTAASESDSFTIKL